ncbi:MAG: bifunctional adenosylcobinamide kinase/adenosylcobinamide-phosphate guanylyltransferase [Propionibacteriaceae bacterium]|nr:bifunctional adenosylcobinamide kinase/adenosylcobinamide-phosphate guanylyltransferase [Propionibacteriaceae bacterium]
MVHVLVTGGVRSGKSRHAESLLAADTGVSYLTPGYPADPAHDAEWAARVAAHQLRRPPTWRTVETLDLAAALADADGPVLIDCLGTWLTRLLDAWHAWDDEEAAWAPRLATETAALAAAIGAHPSDVVVVTNEVGWGLVSEYRAGRLFADHLGRVNQAVAAVSDRVVLMVAGRPLVL